MTQIFLETNCILTFLMVSDTNSWASILLSPGSLSITCVFSHSGMRCGTYKGLWNNS